MKLLIQHPIVTALYHPNRTTLSLDPEAPERRL